MRLKSDMLSAERNEVASTPQCGDRLMAAGALRTVSSTSNVKLLPLQPRNLSVEWSAANNGDSDDDGSDGDEDEFFDALEGFIGNERTTPSAVPEGGVDKFALTGYESELHPRQENRGRRVGRVHRKDGNKRTIACCGGA